MDLDFFDSYSITACRIDCETRYLVENCNCRMVHMPGEALGPSARRGPPPPPLPMQASLLPTGERDQLAAPHSSSSSLSHMVLNSWLDP